MPLPFGCVRSTHHPLLYDDCRHGMFCSNVSLFSLLTLSSGILAKNNPSEREFSTVVTVSAPWLEESSPTAADKSTHSQFGN